MITALSSIRLQAWLYVLLIYSFMSGLLSLTAYAWPQLSIPEGLMVTMEGALSLVLGGVVMVSLMMGWKSIRLITSVLLLVIVSYNILHNFLAGPDDHLSILTGQHRLNSAPAIYIILLVAVALFEVKSQSGRRFGIFIGAAGISIGIITLIAHLTSGNSPFIFGFSRGASLFCLVFGLSLLILCHIARSENTRINTPAAAIGALGAIGTFTLLIVASWGIHLERHRLANALVYYQSTVLEQELNTSANLIERLADRWAILDLDIPESLKQTELTRYFQDTPSLKSLLVIGEDHKEILNEARTIADKKWLTSQMKKLDVSQWINSIREQKRSDAWLFPDSTHPLDAIFLTIPGGAGGGVFIATFNIGDMQPPISNIINHGFEVRIASEHENVSDNEWHIHDNDNNIYEYAKTLVPGGAAISITAIGGAVGMFSLPGILLPCILFFGLFVSYLLTAGRIITAIQKQNARELSIEEQRFSSLFFQSPDAIFEFSKDGRYVSLNAKAKAITGITEQDLDVLCYDNVLSASTISDVDYRTFDTSFKKTINGSTQIFNVKFLNIDGCWRNYECSFVPILVDDAVVGLYAVVKDVTERLLAQENQRILTKSLESSDSAVLVVDVRTQIMPITFANTAFSNITGYSREEVFNSTFSAIINSLKGADSTDIISSVIEKAEAKSFTIKSYRRDGTPFWNQLSLTPVKDDSGIVTHYTTIMKDVSEKREQQKQLAYQATHDVLTGLANRSLLEDRLEHDIALAKRSGKLVAVLFIDLDTFKPINDTLGHRIGDEVLISVARRLQSVTRNTDTLARFGGDEFVLLLPNLESQQDAEVVAELLLSEISQVHQIGVHELYVTASIGISFLTENIDISAKMLQQADMAMYKAKQQGRDTYVSYSDDLDKKLSKRVILRNELQEAIKAGQLFLNYQPQVNQHGEICGLEALVRWKHPNKGLVSPADFIPIAEETGQIIHLGRWVTTQACKDAKQLLDMGILKGRMAVNLSQLQFHRPGFMTTLLGILNRTNLPPTYLELELTESILMRNSEGAIDILRELESKGITTSIDDFGTGYSSFSYLKDLPVESVKIDKSFVDSVLSDRKDAAVCKGIITMAGEMGIRVIAEGVETREQFERLKSYGCEAFQGYYFAKPMAFDDLITWMQSNEISAINSSI